MSRLRFDKEVNAQQYDLLTGLINENKVVFAIQEPLASDDLNIVVKMTSDLKDVEDLALMGFVEDVSDSPKFKPLIDKAKEEKRRAFKVFVVTQMGLMCFTSVNGQGAVNQ